MNEYISREELIKALETDYNRSWCSKPQGSEEYVEGVRYAEGVRDEYDDVLKITCAMAAADVQPVKHGRWENTNMPNQLRCSNCGIIHVIVQCPHGDIKYCPNCGARMDSKQFKRK